MEKANSLLEAQNGCKRDKNILLCRSLTALQLYNREGVQAIYDSFRGFLVIYSTPYPCQKYSIMNIR